MVFLVRLRPASLVSTFATVLAAAPALAADYVVSPGGNDAAEGSAAAPWGTLQHAADLVGPGDTVVVRAGNYAGFDLRRSGAEGAPISFVAEPGAAIVADNGITPDGVNIEDAAWIVIEGFDASRRTRAGFRAAVCHHVTFRGNRAAGNTHWGIFTGFCDDVVVEGNAVTDTVDQHGIYLSNSGDRPVVRGNLMAGNASAGLHMNGDASMGGDGLITGALIEGNVISNNGARGASGINLDGVQDSVIRNNLLHGNHASGISLFQGDGAEPSHRNVVVNNTIVQAANGRWALNIQNGSTDIVALNNILWSAHAFRGAVSISPASLACLESDYNVVIDRFTTDDADTILSLADWQATTGLDAHSTVAGPEVLFRSYAGQDFHLLAGAPAVDRGTPREAPPMDLDGVLRPTGEGVDIGAYEYCEGDACLGGVLTPDAAVPAPDAAALTPDAGGVTPDAAVLRPDAAVLRPDAAVPTSDAAVPTSDTAVPTSDAAVPVGRGGAHAGWGGGARRDRGGVAGCSRDAGRGRGVAGPRRRRAVGRCGFP